MVFNVGFAIRIFRKGLKLNQAQFAKKMETAQGWVSVWETGKAEPMLRILARMCKKFGVKFILHKNGRCEFKRER